MKKLESTIPFDGFYESFISADIDHEIEIDTEYYSELYDLNKSEEELLCNSFLNINSYKFYNQIAKDYTNFYIDALNERLKGFTLKATYKCLKSPREYNFKTDRIFIEIEKNHAVDFIEHVVKNYKKELEKKIEDRFTSRSGFISFYKNNIDLWTKDFKEWDCNMIGICFELFDLEEDCDYLLFINAFKHKYGYKPIEVNGKYFEVSPIRDLPRYIGWQFNLYWNPLEGKELRDYLNSEVKS